MTNALEDHNGSVSIGGQIFINLRFAEDIVVVVDVEEGKEADDIVTGMCAT